MQPVIPLFPGTKPYQQIPFQYSLHYIKSAGGPLLHKEFLAESGENPLQAIAEALCRDIPMNVCVTAYNKSFECSRIKELAGMFPDLSEHLLNIKENIKDLLDPFQAGNYYNRAMGGSFSIKSVLPAIFPDDPELNYHNLEGVHNGSEAMTIFPRIKDMPAGTYDMILMDIQMPKMDGYKATQAIRHLPDKDKACIPIVAMTANAFEEDKRDAVAAGMNGHIAKPIQIDKLLSMLAEVLRQ